MKKLMFIAFLLLISCEKESTSTGNSSKQYCAVCTERNTGYEAPKYCGNSYQVDLYISDLKKSGASQGQTWTCRKY